MQPSEEDIAWFKSTFRPIPKPVLPEDCIEYSIYLFSPELDRSNDSENRLQLRNVQKYTNELLRDHLKDYIWQRQSFSLELAKEDGLSFLRGKTEYGDSIEDEWVIVWILRELSRKYSKIWIKVTDSDGEFLLIEASGTIPEWLEPDVAENRVWINQGRLKILKPASSSRSSKHTKEKLSLQDAKQIMLQESNRIMHSSSIEEEAFYRLRDYPAKIKDNMHHALVTVPRKVAFLLLQRPAYISSAIEAFYLRDPVALKALRRSDSGSDLQFPPDDLVTLSVKFSKVGYAQIKSQDFPAPSNWIRVLPSTSDSEAHSRTTSGMKITCGFEMLLFDQQYQDKQTVREMKMVLDDLQSGDEILPTDVELATLDQREDDEKWMDIDFNDLERELGGQNGGSSKTKKPEFGDKAAQENLQRIVKQFENFLNEKEDDCLEGDMISESSESDNVENDIDEDSDFGEDKDASFDEDQFTKMMQEMMGMPSDVMKEIMSGTIDALSDSRPGNIPSQVRARGSAKIKEMDSSDEDEDDFKQMESELRASGALDMSSTSTKHAISQGPSQDRSIEESDRDEDSDDFDAEFARNILQSFKSSGGMGGPAANLMSMMNDSTKAGGSNSNKPGKTQR